MSDFPLLFSACPSKYIFTRFNSQINWTTIVIEKCTGFLVVKRTLVEERDDQDDDGMEPGPGNEKNNT